MFRCLLPLSGIVLFALISQSAEIEDDASWLFGFEKVESAHLIFAPDQWKALKPPEPARGPGGAGAFSPGAMLVPGFLKGLDGDQSGALSREEFVGGFSRWFQGWDVKQQGFLDADAICDGMTKDLIPSFNPPPGGNPGGPSPNGTPPPPSPAAQQGGPASQAPGTAPAAPPAAGPRPGGPMGFSLLAPEGKRNGLSGMIGVDFDYVHADLEFAGDKFSDVAVRYKGNGTYMESRNTEKKSFKIDLNEFTRGQKLFGLTKLNFHSNITDAAWMNEPLAYALYREAGVPAPRTSYVRLSVTVPGTYDRHSLGLYTLVENPDTNWANHHFGSKKGLILKPVTQELFIDKGPDWSAYNQAYDPKTDITESQVQRVVAFARLVTHASDEEFAAQLPDFLDIDEFTRFMAVTVWLSSTDSILMLGQNYVVHLDPETEKFSFVPWDLDRSFGNFFVPNPEELSVRKAWTSENRFLNRVMNVPAVRETYLARLEEFQKSIFEPARLMQRIDAIAALIRPAVAEESAEKATRFDKALAEIVTDQTPASEPPGGPGGFRMLMSRQIKVFIKARHQSVADQLAGKSEGRSLASGFGPPPGGGGGAGPGGGSGPGGPGRAMFGPGRFLGPILTEAADTDSNAQVTAEEFAALATRWFDEWDSDSDGSLTAQQLQEGLSKAFPLPNFNGGPPPPAPPRQ